MEENIREILIGGQTFSWTEESEGVFRAVLNGHVYRVKTMEDALEDPYLRAYFDLDYDYDCAREEIRRKDPVLKVAVEAVGKLRILKQDPWITTVSFILSQNNNIKRIKGLYDELSRHFGHEVEPGFFSFPSPEELARADEKTLRSLGVGFRAPYLLDAVEKHQILENVEFLPFDEALEQLERIKGIGPKVASCILIFGYGRREGFPMDTWMKQCMALYYPGKDSSYFAPYQALSQQYLFSYMRSKD
ncbi:MAG: DNA lyase [Spirochaetales bacterium]|nr:DNA lyase [Candidatus Physcosoma equi]